MSIEHRDSLLLSKASDNPPSQTLEVQASCKYQIKSYFIGKMNTYCHQWVSANNYQDTEVSKVTIKQKTTGPLRQLMQH